jgi:hypothetical protein
MGYTLRLLFLVSALANIPKPKKVLLAEDSMDLSGGFNRMLPEQREQMFWHGLTMNDEPTVI